MTHKIAIITLNERYTTYDDYERVVDTITDWTEVSDDDFSLLVKAQQRSGMFNILEQPGDTSLFVAKTIQNYLDSIKNEEAQRLVKEQKKKEAALVRKNKKDLKTREAKLALLAQLKAELEVNK